MKTLISLEQIVEQQLQIKQSSSEFKEAIKISVNALKQQPQLNHFIPCVEKDGKFEVLEKPKGLDLCSPRRTFLNDYENELKYKSSYKNVLFKCKANVFSDEHIRLDFENEVSLHWYKGSFDSYKGQQLASYSDLTKYNLPLTDNGEIYFNLKN